MVFPKKMITRLSSKLSVVKRSPKLKRQKGIRPELMK